jgi:hypothetical protein
MLIHGSFRKEKVRLFANVFYYLCLALVMLFLLLGVIANVGLVANSQSKIHEYGVGVYKYTSLGAQQQRTL